MGRFKRMGALVGLVAAALGLATLVLVPSLRAEDERGVYRNANRTCYQNRVDIGAAGGALHNAERFDFAGCPGWAAGQGAFEVEVINATNTKDLIYKLIPMGTAMPASGAASDLTTPVADTATDVQLCTGATGGANCRPAPWPVMARGIVLQSKVDADKITATVRITY